jgi:uncharacterized protein YjbI with pentapeptide repeats
MNDAVNEPQEVPSRYRKISEEELQRILADHKRWMEAGDKTGLDHLRADLSRAELLGASLKISAHQGGAPFDTAELQGAHLQGANLVDARLQWAKLGEARLQGAYLTGAQLQGANLYGAQLQGAYLYGAQLQGAGLRGANFCEADLRGASFERLEVKKDGKAGQERSADLANADFHDADLSDAQLKTVNGLRGEMLAGAVLTNAKLPDDVARFDQLKHVEETSRNAITVFFGLLAACLYSWLTIATTTDLALITGLASCRSRSSTQTSPCPVSTWPRR